MQIFPLEKRPIMSAQKIANILPGKNSLIYINAGVEGYSRKKRGKYFEYYLGTQKITDKEIIQRIKSLVIPPAWREVWICKSANGHLQATGIDARNRKQYRYHPEWNSKRNEMKFEKLLEFGKILPQLHAKIEKDLNRTELVVEKVLAAVISLMEKTYIRIGNSMYEKEYGSYGLTTLKDKHIKINGNEMKLSFRGKKGIEHSISLKSKKLARIIKQCRDIPGSELFQYYDEGGKAHPIDSGMVNNYIREIACADFTAKDFRTWAGSIHAISTFMRMEETDKKGVIKKNIVEVIDCVSKKLGNTRSVCKKYYIHPLIISLYEEGKLNHFLKCKQRKTENNLSHEENILLKILNFHKSTSRRMVA